MVASPQVLHDCGIITASNHGANDSLYYQGGRPKISITVPPNSSQKISWLKSIIILATNNDETFEFLPRIEIVNETKGTKWTYSKHFIGIPETSNDLYWLTSWRFRGDELEAGDHISLTVLSDSRVLHSGIDLVYDSEPDDKCKQLMSKCSSFFSRKPGNESPLGVLKLNVDSSVNEVLHDCGIITASVPEINDIPYYGAGRPPKVSITVPPNSIQKISWAKSIIFLVANNDETFEFLLRIEIVNETKGTKWTYSKHFIGIPETNNTLYCLTSCKFRGDELQAGDHISLTLLSDLRVLQSGIDLVYDYEPDDKCNSLDQIFFMAVSMIHEASTSISRYTYHVFLSFKGTDTRKNFTDHLYTALVQAGIHTFRDDEEIERGKNINDEIEKTILHESKISIIVFSKNYAASTRCLNELVKILERKKSSQHIVLPVFYDVDPTQVKKQTGSYAEAFAKHEECFKSEMDKVQRWRVALKEVANFAGMVLQDSCRHESQFIQDIVKQIQNKLYHTVLYVPSYLVGIDSLVTRINRWIEEDGSNNTGIATICGIGGIGKTTIAKVIFNQNIQRFEGYSFLSDVRETTQERNGLVRLQRQLISDILKGKANKIYSADDGILKINEAVCCRRVLIVLDDVDDLENITKIIGMRIPFFPGSKIILTSRRRHLLSGPFITQMFDLKESSSYGDLCKVFEVKELAFNESLQLFNWYAFGHNSITESFMEYASNIVNYCGGLPLALQVLGSSLSSKSMSVWKSALEKLEAIPDSKIQKILRVSYDSLQDDHDKNLFLDIACLFIGKDRDYTATILDGCGFYTTVGIENLIGRSLLIINEKNKLMMHQMVRDMGKEIIRQESLDPGKRSRLWGKDAFDVIREKIGSKTIKSLTVDLQGLLENKSKRTTPGLHFAKHSKNRFVMSNEVNIETEAFAKMQRLKLLQLDYVKLKGDFKDFPKGLIWLRWHGFPLQSLPTDFDIKRLVVLDMRNSNVKHFWKDTECLPNLKILNLNHSHGLLKTPNFLGLPSLEKLMLKDCIKLTEVDESIGELKALTFLSLKGCKNLMKLPRTIGLLLSLEVLILCGCSRLDNIPRELQNMKSLRVLNLNGTAIYQSKSWMSWLSLKRSKELGFFWAYLPCSLVKLSLESCRLSTDVMPNDFSSLPSLKFLNLSKNPIHSLPKSISSLAKLNELLLTSCSELQLIPKLPIFCPLIGIYMSSSPLTHILSSLQCLMSWKRCMILGCEKLAEVEGVFKLEPIENFEVEQIKNIFNIDFIESNKVQLFNYLTDTKIVTTPQVVNECGITSTFISGSEVPIRFDHRTKGSRIAFSLPAPSHSGEKISCFNLCIVFSLVSGQIFDFPPSLFIFNETKDIMWGYLSNFIGIPETNNNTMLWLVHWPTMGFQLEGGDFVSCTVSNFHFNVREFGVRYESENGIRYEYDFPHYIPGNELVTRNIQFELTEDLLSLDSYENVKVQICNYSDESEMVASPQVLHDCGIITASVPAISDLPCFRAGRPSKVSITVPPNSNQKISWVKSIFILAANTDETFEFLPRIEFVNETKGTKWTYSKHFIGIPETKNRINWLTSWKFRGDELEAGDHISLTVHSDLRVLESGIDLVYDYKPDDKCNSLDRLQWMGKCSGLFSSAFVYNFFKSQRNLYRMQTLLKW
ncbi:disease resistance protein RML1B-like [Durio zibethinus]|uniref:ADP-ribosyl cyclase/cyclic ADP-ribose hydrolase n=1 Tax=Durio zibethinus TaxID=66656 RepID=A0A6P5YTL6_DURZI|nr:disease resistance protein RML1B-like [Durio zibethinus]